MSNFSYSFDEEYFQGVAGDIEGAIINAMEDISEDDSEGGTTFWIGESVPPPQPETFWSASDWLDHVSCQDEYSHFVAEDWDESTPEQRAELEAEVRAVMAKWLDKNRLRPRFNLIHKPEKYFAQNGVAVLASEVKAELK